MKLQSVLDLKTQVLTTLRKHDAARRPGTSVESPVNPYPANRIAVGYSAVAARGQFQLELRVQRLDGPAFRQAEQIKLQAAGEANIEVIPRIEIPTKTSTEEAGCWRGFCGNVRPLHIGLSVGHKEDTPGTLGAFLQTDDGVAVLSNSHVLALSGEAEEGDWVYQPGRETGRSMLANTRIGKLKNFTELSRANRNSSDSAIALLEPGVDHLSNRVPTGHDFPDEGELIRHQPHDPSSPFDPRLSAPNKRVCKVGRTTGWTEGMLTAMSIDDITVSTRLGNVVFDNVMEITWLARDNPFTKPGDSGSLVYTREELAAIGLHFAAGTKGTGKQQTWSAIAVD